MCSSVPLVMGVFCCASGPAGCVIHSAVFFPVFFLSIMHLQLCCWECCAVPLGQLCLEKVIYVVEAVLVYFSVLILSHIKMQHWCWECLLCLWAGCVCILCAFQFCIVDFAFFPFIILLFLFPTVFLFRMYMLLLWGVYEVVIFKPT